MTKTEGLTTTIRKDLYKQVLPYAKVDIKHSIFMIVFDWSFIVLTAFFTYNNFNILTYIAAILLIAGRQQALLAVLHEATHNLLAKNTTLNNFLGNWFAAYPILASIDWYGFHHHPHHQHLNTELDQTWTTKLNKPEWQFPQSKIQFLKIMLKQPFVGGIDWLVMMYKGSELYPLKDLNSKQKIYSLIQKFIYYFLVCTALTYLQAWSSFFLYWFIPLFFVLPVLQRFRRMSEHFGVERTHDFNGGRDLTPNWFEKLFFSPHNVGYHLAHHQFPNVPQHNLPQLHRLLMQYESYQKYSHQNDSYIFPTQKSLLKDLVT